MTESLPDLERQATSAYLRGDDEATEELWTRAHNEYLQRGDVERAARCVFWLALDLFNRREWARGNGWVARARHMIEPVGDCASLGLLLVLATRDHLRLGAIDAAAEAATRACELAGSFQDAELNIFSRMALALVHTRRGQPKEAASLFDETMVGVTVDNVSPIAVGVVYCAVIDACRSLFDLSRAREWTTALDRWCSTQPNIVAFRGKCLVHRTEILRLNGAWSQAFAEAEQACAWSGAHENSFRYPAGAAFYELAELHRLRGDVDEATTAYRRASDHGQVPEPGLTLLHFARGQHDVAATTIRRLLTERQASVTRAEVLLAAAEILVAVNDIPAARVAADELLRMHEQFQSPALRALAAHSAGTVRLAEGDVPESLNYFREAWTLWQELEIPYQAARVRVLMGQAYQRSGDPIAAAFELDAARSFFQRVGAQPDIERVDKLGHVPARSTEPTLSTRELEVIQLLATGKTNREIAKRLSISERTVDRHVSNILLKLNLSTRSAATAWAFRHELVPRDG